jgi:hypothetical protein
MFASKWSRTRRFCSALLPSGGLRSGLHGKPIRHGFALPRYDEASLRARSSRNHKRIEHETIATSARGAAGAILLILVLALTAFGGGGRTIITPPPEQPPAPDPDACADQLTAQTALAEGLQLVQGIGMPGSYVLSFPRGAGGYIPGISRLGIPSLYFSDGSAGFSSGLYEATALPSSIYCERGVQVRDCDWE